MASDVNDSKLKHALSDRQVSMITIGGIIGAGLFIVSASAINSIGPAVLISYMLTGLLCFFVMRMLGEMAVLNPDSGSFSTYATKALGHWAGFTVGWLYWWYWALVIAFEAVLGAGILNAYFPEIPGSAFAIGIVLILAVTNMFDVRNFGEFEFWFALTKVIAIIAFIVICALAIFGYWPLAKNVSGISNLYSHGGFLPQGYSSILQGVLITIFSFFGIEMLSIAAAEAKHPEKQIRRSINLVIYRIALFYILSIFLVLCIVPWNDPGLQKMGTFQYVLSVLNVPGTKLVMDIVVFVAVCSVLNSGIYVGSRMLFSLADRGDAPKVFGKVTVKGVPKASVLLTTLVALLAVCANYFFSKGLFSFLLSTIGSIGLIVYLVVACSQYKLRRTLEKNGTNLTFKMWLFPWLTWAVIILIVMTLGYMLVAEKYQYEALMTSSLTIAILIASFIVKRKKGAQFALNEKQSSN
ncbi:amino acid permease [Acinetobacter pittii]|uniref:amino acid permease n=1 Tax=Acinetobacter pittii TaxID=48296 RepID=UPI00197E9293|nr:amino acid permease [Acinetobacter pittii]MBN6492015.1 amino acid permease [Acinetobacter pittii]MDO7426471.1 amino acid permease [Acinetobacter baumannii]